MAVKRRLTGYSGMRVDWPHVRSIESSISYDFDSVLRGVIVGSNPYLLRGFDLQIPTTGINVSSLVIKVSDSAVLHGSAGESGTILTVPAGTPDDVLNSSNPHVVGSFQNGVPNYVSLAYKRSTDPDTADITAGWSEAQKAEFKRTVPIGRVLDYQYIITTSDFSTNLPLYIVGVSATGAFEYATKAASGLFRLGTGGTVPDPYSSYGFGGLANPQSPTIPRREWLNENTTIASNPVTAMPGDDVNAFKFGDWSIKNLKEWMDAMMTRIKEITGSLFWYVDTSLGGVSGGGQANISDLYFDAVDSVLTGNGYMAYNLIIEAGIAGWSASTTYAVGRVISYNGITYYSLVNSNTGNIPSSSPSDWLVINAGAFQSQFTDSGILPGDSYIEGVTSGNRASISSFNGNQLVINSLLRSGFVYDEILRNRRIYRPNLGLWSLADQVVGSDSLGILARTGVGSGSAKSISSWTYSGNLITATSAAHGYQPGTYISVTGLSGTNPPNGVFMIKNVTATTFQYSVAVAPLSIGGDPGTARDTVSSARHPYMPRFNVTSWDYNLPLHPGQVTLTVPNHSIDNGSDIVVWGLSAGTNAPNGRFTSVIVNSDRTISYTPVSVPTGTFTVTAGVSYLSPDSHTFTLTVTGAAPDVYNVDNLTATAWSDTQLSYRIGPNTLPATVNASGAIELDGVVAISTVSNPAKVVSIVNTGSSPNYVYTVTTATPHGYSNITGPIDTTIYGDSSLSPYIRTYQSVSIVVISPTVYEIHPIAPNGTLIDPPPFSYTNGGSDEVFAKFPDNPYPGPVQWTSDLIIKGVIGDRYFLIPQTADADGTPLADRFNINGQHGTVFLQNGEVAYVVLKRNLLVSNGSTYTTIGGDTITGPALLDPDNIPLVPGDFVRFEGEGENRWVRIASIYGGGIKLVSDNGQTPTLTQRPAHTGRLLASKTQYDVVHVAPHYLVPNSPDVYWLAVRRDNGSLLSKVYLKALELEAGEKRQINDNEPSNLLIYTGAGNEAAINPNYTVIDASGVYQRTETLTVGSNAKDKDASTRTLTFGTGPELGFQAEDKVVYTDSLLNQTTFTVNYLLSSRTVVFKEDVSPVALGASVVYYRTNYKINDTDNLTLAQRKTNREQAKVNTALERPIYDESIYPQLIHLSSNTTLHSGGYIYQGPVNSPTSLAWVLHGNQILADIESVEDNNIQMPSGAYGDTFILVHIIIGTFTSGAIYQNGATSWNVNNDVLNLTSPTIVGDPLPITPGSPGGDAGTELVLPPNRRTQLFNSGSYLVWPSNASYKQSLDPALSGEELLVIANDTVRQASVDYKESFGGPKGKIRLLRDLPPNSRMRFRIMPAYGSALAKISGGVSLQVAYDGGRFVTVGAGSPISISAGGGSNVGIELNGSMTVNGSGVGGIFSGGGDQNFNVGDATSKPKEVWAGFDYIKQQAGYTGSEWKRTSAAGFSTGTSATQLPTTAVTVPPNYSARIKMNVTARRTDTPTSGRASFTIEGAFYNDGAGVLPAGSPTTTFLGSASDGNVYAISFGIVGNNVILVVYGSSGSTIQWVVGIDSQQVSDSL